MKYWTVHMDEFFDHYLLNKPRPEWMDKGVPFLQKGTRDVSPMFKRADAPKPAATAAARLAQMRQLARRFTAAERYNNETVECRLIAQPIDRYQSEAQKVADGAIFALANGTNPEIGLALESDGEKWRYGILRFCSADATVSLDGRQIVAYEKFNARGRFDGAYTSRAYKLEPGK